MYGAALVSARPRLMTVRSAVAMAVEDRRGEATDAERARRSGLEPDARHPGVALLARAVLRLAAVVGDAVVVVEGAGQPCSSAHAPGDGDVERVARVRRGEVSPRREMRPLPRRGVGTLTPAVRERPRLLVVLRREPVE